VSLCIVAAKGATQLAAAAFTLAWTHSVERVAWEEDWRVTPAGLVIVEARIKGSGAGMEPPDGATLEGGWWRYRPALPPSPEIVLAASGAAGTWTLCAADACTTLGATPAAPIRLAPCEDP
jgi:hypothetical protein